MRVLACWLAALVVAAGAGCAASQPARVDPAPAPKAGPAPLLEGCTAKPQVLGWRYECTGVLATIQDTDDPPGAVDGYRSSMPGMAVHTIPSATRTRWVRTTLAGEDVPVFVAQYLSGPVLLAAVGHPAGVRFMTCTGEEARCVAVLGALASSGWRSGPAEGSRALAAKPPVLLGRPVDIPPGCVGVGSEHGGEVRCEGGFRADWTLLAPSLTQWILATTAEDERAALGGEARIDTVPCRIAGNLVTCRRLRGNSADGQAFTVLKGILPTGFNHLMARCSAPGDTGSAAPCSLVIAAGGPALTLLGNAVDIPEGCRSTSIQFGSRIDCPRTSGSAYWASVPADLAEKLVQGEQDEMEKVFRDGGLEVRRDTVPCRLAGSRTTCRRLQATRYGRDVYALVAAVPNGRTALNAHCVAPATDAVPCTLLFETR